MSIDRGGNSAGSHSDEELILLARAGDRGAFGELWQRHSRSGLRVARQFTSSIDADDLVSEAYARIYQRVLAGGGPDGAFRPYLYTTIRNLASRWGQSRRDVNVDDMGAFEDPTLSDDPATIALDRTLTVRAFRALPERWQSVLWYTEVEGMDPHEVAPILGISANGVAALAYRAREGLRKAWLQAHVSDATASGGRSVDCTWSIARLGDYARDGLTARDRTRVDDHLAICATCSIINEEVDEVGSRLALVMLPLLLGGIAGGTLLASFGAPGSAMAASAAPAMPPAFGTLGSVGSVAVPAVSSGLTAAAISAPLVGVLTVALVVSGGLAVGVTAVPPTPSSASSASTSAANSAAIAASGPLGGSGSPTDWQTGQGADELTLPPLSLRPVGATVGATASGILDPLGSALGSTLDAAGGVLAPVTAPVGSAVDGTVTGAGKAVGGLVTDVTNPINTLIPGAAVGPGTPPRHTAPGGVVGATTALDLSGTGIPGATVSLQSAGVVYATTKITPQGTWAIHLSAFPAATTGLQLKQTVLSVLGIDLGTPLRVLSNSLGVGIDVLGR